MKPGPIPAAGEAIAAMARGDLSAAALMRAALDRIAAVNPAINAVVSLRPETDLIAEAEAADAVPQDRRGPLHGLPLAIKDLVETAGIVTTFGSPAFAEYVPKVDEPLAARLRAAGAILIGKTNVPEAGLGSNSFNDVFGATRNPFDTSRSAGGSSGGAGAGLAAGMLPVADGSDAMGSLRNPAAWNGVYGLRPTWGCVAPAAVSDPFLHPLSTDGPMARDPADLHLLLSVLAAPDPLWPHAQSPLAPLPDTPEPEALTLAWLGDWGGAWPMEDGLLAAGEAALGAFGARIVRPAPPVPAEGLWFAWTTLRHWAVAAKHGEVRADPARRALMKPELIWEIERGEALMPSDIRRASAIRAEAARALARLAADFDAIALPATQVRPFPVEDRWPEEIAGREMDTYHRWMECMIPVSLTGLPAVAVPAGLSGELPHGIQIAGPRGSDERLISLAAAWHRRLPPPVAPL